jgi:hypothetical protein
VTHLTKSSKRWLIPALAAALIAVCALGCASRAQNPRANLTLSLQDYHDHLIWRRFAEAAGYLPEAQRGQFLGAQEEIGDELVFTEYEVGSIDLNAAEQQAIIQVTLKWYRVPSYIVQETRVRETWSFDEELEVWWLDERSDPETEPTIDVSEEDTSTN